MCALDVCKWFETSSKHNNFFPSETKKKKNVFSSSIVRETFFRSFPMYSLPLPLRQRCKVDQQKELVSELYFIFITDTKLGVRACACLCVLVYVCVSVPVPVPRYVSLECRLSIVNWHVRHGLKRYVIFVGLLATRRRGRAIQQGAKLFTIQNIYNLFYFFVGARSIVIPRLFSLVPVN